MGRSLLETAPPSIIKVVKRSPSQMQLDTIHEEGSNVKFESVELTSLFSNFALDCIEPSVLAKSHAVLREPSSPLKNFQARKFPGNFGGCPEIAAKNFRTWKHLAGRGMRSSCGGLLLQLPREFLTCLARVERLWFTVLPRIKIVRIRTAG
ncbi:hypothetical protein R1flu_018611 [Riccia fluitans]|uniref:Uncharacterized protein n=1 Tax=Riccia fluitans TaxID=41844 RepID=A0ABD1ZGC0_9MARC